MSDASSSHPSYSLGVLRALFVIVAPVATIALFVMWCTSGELKWSKPQAGSEEHKKLLNTALGRKERPQKSTLEMNEQPVSVTIKPNSWAMRSSAL